MAEEFVGVDLSDAVFWGVDLRRATFRDVDLSGVTVSHARMLGLSIDGLVDRLVVNGVDVTDVVNAGDRWYPLRAMLTPAYPEGMRTACEALQTAWAELIGRARALPDDQVHESVGGEWSFVETLRHLQFATDKWFTLPVLGSARMHPFGLPNSGSADLDWPGVDRAASPGFAEMLDVRAARDATLSTYLHGLNGLGTEELDRPVEVIENGTVTVRECLHVVFEEEFEHLRYATRDLDLIVTSAS